MVHFLRSGTGAGGYFGEGFVLSTSMLLTPEHSEVKP
jgi:hypothetical protein